MRSGIRWFTVGSHTVAVILPEKRNDVFSEQANGFHDLSMRHRPELEVEHQFFDADGGQLLDEFDTILRVAHGEASGLDQITTANIISTAAVGPLGQVEFVVLTPKGVSWKGCPERPTPSSTRPPLSRSKVARRSAVCRG